MDDTRNKVLPFPKAPERAPRPEILVQIGNERFAIRWEIEDVPAAAPRAGVAKETEKRT
jgi:hypothetical protein